jgi:tetratricopeptide (TPR) repeat protein
MRAGAWANNRLAYEDAARHYRNALETLEYARPGSLKQRCELLLALGEAEMHAGERNRAREVLYEAAALAKRCSYATLLAQAALRLAPGFFTIEIGAYDSILIDLLENAISAVGASDDALRAQLLARLAMAHGWSGSNSERPRLVLEAIEFAERAKSPVSLAYALAAKHGQLWGPEHLAERVALLERMGDLARESGDSELILMYLLFRITAGLEQGMVESVDNDIARYIEIAEILNRPQSLWYTHSFRSARALMQGRFAEARGHAERLLSVGSRVSDINSVQTFGINAAIQLLQQDRAAETLPLVEQFVDRHPRTLGWRYSRALMYYEAGRVIEARSQFDLLAADRFASIPRNEQWSISACLASDLCHGLGDQQRAEVLYAELLPGSEYACVIGFGVAYFGTIARRLGNLAGTMRRWKLAEEHFACALRKERSAGATPWVAQVLYDHSVMLAARNGRGDRARGCELLLDALGIATELGMVSLVRKVELLRNHFKTREA